MRSTSEKFNIKIMIFFQSQMTILEVTLPNEERMKYFMALLNFKNKYHLNLKIIND